MKVNITHETVKDEDFFKAFEEPKEKFEQPEIKTDEPVTETGSQSNQEKTDLLNSDLMDTAKTTILTKADKDGLADFFVTTVTNYIDDLAGGYTGIEEKGRYMPKPESIREIKKSVSNLIPDKFRMPEWLKLVILLSFAYFPINKKVKKDRKEMFD